MRSKTQHKGFDSLTILGLIWLLGAVINLTWLILDRSVPSWDLANHLTGSLNYWWTLHNAQWGSGEWWTDLWRLSSKYPPLVYISTAPFIEIFGRGIVQATTVNLLFSAILLGSIYGLGRHLFNVQVGLWSAALCVLFPRFYRVQVQYLIDYPLTAWVAASFFCLTVWRDAKSPLRQWLWALAFGICLGCALFTKQSALFFLLMPLLWVGGTALWQKAWGRLAQLVFSLLICLTLLAPWFTINWIFQISVWLNANVDPATSEGDPPVNTLAAWTYYWNDLPRALTVPLLIVPLVGLILAWSGRFSAFRDRPSTSPTHASQPNTAIAFRWLALFLVSAYLILSAIFNKDHRYVMPLLAVFSVVLGYGLSRWQGRWQGVRWVTVGIAFVLMLLNLFPIGGAFGGALTQALSPQAERYPYLGADYPHVEVIQEIIRTQPYQRHTLAVLHATATLNENTFNYYGNRENFQVYARRLGNSDRFLDQDLRSLSWFIVQPGKLAGESGKVRRQRAEFLARVEQSVAFQRQKTWELPEGDRLHLFRRKQPPVTVQPLNPNRPIDVSKVQLVNVTVPTQAPANAPIPVTYEWSGRWQDLHEGLVLLTWKPQATTNLTHTRSSTWIHDHAIGLGNLHPGVIQANSQTITAAAVVKPDQAFRVIERTAMLPPSDLPPGTYTLQATYLNTTTGDTYPIPVTNATLNINPTAPPVAAPEVDWVSQLRHLALTLRDGTSALEGIFDPIGRFNIYDPIQSYIVQAEQSLHYRLEQEPDRLDDAYGLVLAQALQRKAKEAIATLEQIVRLDPQNPYAHAYLATANLYLFRPGAAQTALTTARALKPDSPEIQALSAVADLMQGNLWQAWQHGRSAISLLSQ
jgi:4-amino-4-deoxy-L-arabinose transferase-like glycosyltransferase